MELLPKEIQLIVYRYVFHDYYRSVIKEYKYSSRWTDNRLKMSLPWSMASKSYNWRDYSKSIPGVSYDIYSNTWAAVAKLSPNFLYAQLHT